MVYYFNKKTKHMIQQITQVFGYIFAAVGVAGFLPFLVFDGNLLGIFEVNAVHNIIHLATGLAALYVASLNNVETSKMFFKIFGVVYAVVALLGFVMAGDILGLFSVNGADGLLHVVVAAAALYVGFVME